MQVLVTNIFQRHWKWQEDRRTDLQPGFYRETEFQYSRCIRQEGVEAPVLWGRVAKYVLWRAEEKWRAKGCELSFGGQHDNEYTLRGMMWADNYWMFSHNQENLNCMMNDIIEELLDLDVEPKTESMWWTSTHKDEDMRTLCVGGRDKGWDLPFCEVVDVLGCRFHRDGKGFQGVA